MICPRCGSVCKGFVGDQRRDVPNPVVPDLAAVLADIATSADHAYAIKRAGDGLATLAALFVTRNSREAQNSSERDAEERLPVSDDTFRSTFAVSRQGGDADVGS